MKNLQKLILPVLMIALIALVYLVYFNEKGIGSFTDFDPNNSAVKELKVNMVQERGVTPNDHGGAVFYVTDKNNTLTQVNADQIPPGIENASTVIIKGHLSSNGSFHAHGVEID